MIQVLGLLLLMTLLAVSFYMIGYLNGQSDKDGVIHEESTP